MNEGAHALTLLLLAAFAAPASPAQVNTAREPAAVVQELTGTVRRVDRIDRTVRIASGGGTARTPFVEVTSATRVLGLDGVARLDDLGVGDTVRVIFERPASGTVARSIELLSRRRE